MKVMLTEANMTEAMELYIHDKITVPDDAKLIVEFVAGRGDNGFSATVGIYGPGEEPAVAGTKKATNSKATKAPATTADPNAPVKRRGRPPKAVAEAQALPTEAAPVETPVDETKVEIPVEAKAEPIAEVAPGTEPVAEVAATPATTAAPVETAAPVAEPIEAAQTAEAQAPAMDAAPRTSLFGNLKKPVNTPAT